MLKQEVGKTMTWLLLATAIAIIGLLGVFYWDSMQELDNASTPSLTSSNNTATTVAPTLATTVDTASGWKVYSNDSIGFSIEYPQDWTYKENSTANSVLAALSLISPDTGKAVTSSGGLAPYDISIYYYSNIASIGSKSPRYASLESLMKDTSYFPAGYKETKFAGQTAYEATEAGIGGYYSIYFERNGHIFKVFFDRKSTKSELSATENRILSTFTFTN